MATQGWDDHNRSDRYFSVDSGKNYLDTCAPNAVLYTGGDNDTFMLWYAQEVEEFRTDVRVIVLSYYNTDWYIEQSMRQVNESAPLNYTLSLHDYRQGGPNDYLPYVDMKINSIDARQYLDLLKKNYPQLRSDDRNIVPSRIFTIDVNPDEVKGKGIVPQEMDSLIVDKMQLRLLRGGLEKKDLALLDLLTTNNWERPIYVNNTSLSQFNLDLAPYAIQEGNAYRIIPVRNPRPNSDFVNVDASFNNIVNKYKYRGLDDPDIYYTDDYRGFVQNHRSSINSLAEALIAKGDLEKARQSLVFSLEKMPDDGIRYDITTVATVDMLFQVGEKDKAVETATLIGDRAVEMTDYLIAGGTSISLELRKNLYIVAELQSILYENGESELAKKYEDAYDRFLIDLQINDPNRRDF
jgi:hypothetical protein